MAFVEMKDVYKRFPRLDERRRQLAGTLSGGEQQMLAVGGQRRHQFYHRKGRIRHYCGALRRR